MPSIPKSKIKKILKCREKIRKFRLWSALGEILAFPTGMLVSSWNCILEVEWAGNSIAFGSAP